MYINRRVYLSDALLVTEIFHYRYSTINNSARKYRLSTKFDGRFCNLLGTKCTKFYSDSFRFDFFIIRCL